MWCGVNKQSADEVHAEKSMAKALSKSIFTARKNPHTRQSAGRTVMEAPTSIHQSKIYTAAARRIEESKYGRSLPQPVVRILRKDSDDDGLPYNA